MNGLLRDMRYAFRQMGKSPGFTAIAILSLALGIGANTAIFSIVNAVLLSGLPIRSPEEVVEVYTSEANNGYQYSVSSYPDFVDLRNRTDLFSDVAAYEAFFARLETPDFTQPVWGELVSHSIFSMLGIQPATGVGAWLRISVHHGGEVPIRSRHQCSIRNGASTSTRNPPTRNIDPSRDARQLPSGMILARGTGDLCSDPSHATKPQSP